MRRLRFHHPAPAAWSIDFTLYTRSVPRSREIIYAKNKKIRGQAVQDNRDRKNDASYAGIPAFARGEEHQGEATRIPGQTGRSGSRRAFEAVPAFWPVT